MKKPYIENRKTGIDAIKESIRHWINDKIKPLEGGSGSRSDAYMGAATCSLCHIYFANGSCRNCPLNRAGQRCDAYGSAWDEWQDEFIYKNPKGELRAARAMVRTLRAMLPKPAKPVKRSSK